MQLIQIILLLSLLTIGALRKVPTLHGLKEANQVKTKLDDLMKQSGIESTNEEIENTENFRKICSAFSCDASNSVDFRMPRTSPSEVGFKIPIRKNGTIWTFLQSTPSGWVNSTCSSTHFSNGMTGCTNNVADNSRYKNDLFYYWTDSPSDLIFNYTACFNGTAMPGDPYRNSPLPQILRGDLRFNWIEPGCYKTIPSNNVYRKRKRRDSGSVSNSGPMSATVPCLEKVSMTQRIEREEGISFLIQFDPEPFGEVFANCEDIRVPADHQSFRYLMTSRYYTFPIYTQAFGKTCTSITFMDVCGVRNLTTMFGGNSMCNSNQDPMNYPGSSYIRGMLCKSGVSHKVVWEAAVAVIVLLVMIFFTGVALVSCRKAYLRAISKKKGIDVLNEMNEERKQRSKDKHCPMDLCNRYWNKLGPISQSAITVLMIPTIIPVMIIWSVGFGFVAPFFYIANLVQVGCISNISIYAELFPIYIAWFFEPFRNMIPRPPVSSAGLGSENCADLLLVMLIIIMYCVRASSARPIGSCYNSIVSDISSSAPFILTVMFLTWIIYGKLNNTGRAMSLEFQSNLPDGTYRVNGGIAAEIDNTQCVTVINSSTRLTEKLMYVVSNPYFSIVVTTILTLIAIGFIIKAMIVCVKKIITRRQNAAALKRLNDAIRDQGGVEMTDITRRPSNSNFQNVVMEEIYDDTDTVLYCNIKAPDPPLNSMKTTTPRRKSTAAILTTGTAGGIACLPGGHAQEMAAGQSEDIGLTDRILLSLSVVAAVCLVLIVIKVLWNLYNRFRIQKLDEGETDEEEIICRGTDQSGMEIQTRIRMCRSPKKGPQITIEESPSMGRENRRVNSGPSRVMSGLLLLMCLCISIPQTNQSTVAITESDMTFSDSGTTYRKVFNIWTNAGIGGQFGVSLTPKPTIAPDKIDFSITEMETCSLYSSFRYSGAVTQTKTEINTCGYNTYWSDDKCYSDAGNPPEPDGWSKSQTTKMSKGTTCGSLAKTPACFSTWWGACIIVKTKLKDVAALFRLGGVQINSIKAQVTRTRSSELFDSDNPPYPACVNSDGNLIGTYAQTPSGFCSTKPVKSAVWYCQVNGITTEVVIKPCQNCTENGFIPGSFKPPQCDEPCNSIRNGTLHCIGQCSVYEIIVGSAALNDGDSGTCYTGNVHIRIPLGFYTFKGGCPLIYKGKVVNCQPCMTGADVIYGTVNNLCEISQCIVPLNTTCEVSCGFPQCNSTVTTQIEIDLSKDYISEYLEIYPEINTNPVNFPECIAADESGTYSRGCLDAQVRCEIPDPIFSTEFTQNGSIPVDIFGTECNKEFHLADSCSTVMQGYGTYATNKEFWEFLAPSGRILDMQILPVVGGKSTILAQYCLPTSLKQSIRLNVIASGVLPTELISAARNVTMMSCDLYGVTSYSSFMYTGACSFHSDSYGYIEIFDRSYVLFPGDNIEDIQCCCSFQDSDLMFFGGWMRFHLLTTTEKTSTGMVAFTITESKDGGFSIDTPPIDVSLSGLALGLGLGLGLGIPILIIIIVAISCLVCKKCKDVRSKVKEKALKFHERATRTSPAPTIPAPKSA